MEQKTGLRHKSIQLNSLHPRLCKSCRTSFGFCRRLLRTNMSPFHRRRPFFAESRSSAKVITGLHLFLVPSLPKTRNPAVGHRAHTGNRRAAAGPCAGCAHQGAEGRAYDRRRAGALRHTPPRHGRGVRHHPHPSASPGHRHAATGDRRDRCLPGGHASAFTCLSAGPGSSARAFHDAGAA